MAAQNLPLNSISRLVFKGDSLISLKEFDVAEKFYDKALILSQTTMQVDTLVMLYNKLGIVKWKKKEFDKAEYYYQKGLLYDSIAKPGADFYYNISLTKSKRGQRDSALYYLDKSILIYDNLEGSKSAYNVFLHAGRTYKNLQQYQKSLSYLIKAYDGFLSINDFKKIASTADIIAQIQNDLGNTQKAFDYYFESLKYRKKLGDSTALGISYNNIAITHNTKKDYDSAIIYYNRALGFKKEHTLAHAKTLFNLGVSYYSKGDKNTAKKLYNSSLEVKKKLKDTLSILYTVNELILIDIELGNLESAQKNIILSNQLINSIDVPEARYRNYDLQSFYYSQKGDFKQAYKFQKKYAELYKSVFNTRQTEIVQDLQEKYESKKKENENLKLKLKNKDHLNLISTQESKIKNNNILIAFLGLFALLVLSAYLFLRQRQKTLKQQQEYLRLQSIYEGQEIIKRSISKDLHDIVGSNLSGIKLKLEALGTSKNKGKLQENIINGVAEINEQVRLISHRLSPLDVSIEKYKLSEIIISRLSEFQHYNHISIHLDNESPELIDDLPIERQSNLYGILLELLNNISKHSKATSVEITIKKISNDELNLIVKDNGVGFDILGINGIGLINIEQRTSLLKGASEFRKLEDNGTMFYLKFPLKI